MKSDAAENVVSLPHVHVWRDGIDAEQQACRCGSTRATPVEFACGHCGKPITTGCYCSKECADADA